MKEVIRQFVGKFILPILASVIVGFVSAFLSVWSMTDRLDSRLHYLETQVIDEKLLTRTEKIETLIARHELSLDKDLARYEQLVLNMAQRTDDHEKRITHLETLMNETRSMLSEIRSDVKTLLRGGK